MKLHPDRSDVATISAYGSGWIQVGDQRVTQSVVLCPDGSTRPWGCSRFEALRASHFEELARLAAAQHAELVVFGSGHQLRFVHPAWQQALMALRIGVETMGTDAACRTYNVLAMEDRRVMAALLLESDAATRA